MSIGHIIFDNKYTLKPESAKYQRIIWFSTIIQHATAQSSGFVIGRVSYNFQRLHYWTNSFKRFINLRHAMAPYLSYRIQYIYTYIIISALSRRVILMIYYIYVWLRCLHNFSVSLRHIYTHVNLLVQVLDFTGILHFESQLQSHYYILYFNWLRNGMCLSYIRV